MILNTIGEPKEIKKNPLSSAAYKIITINKHKENMIWLDKSSKM